MAVNLREPGSVTLESAGRWLGVKWGRVGADQTSLLPTFFSPSQMAIILELRGLSVRGTHTFSPLGAAKGPDAHSWVFEGI